MVARYGSDLMVEAMQACGLRYISLNPGSSYRGLHDSLVNMGSPEILLCPHEEVAVGLAHGFTKASREPMAVALHDVVGLLHAAMAIYYAYIDRIPMMLFGGAGPMDLTRRRPNIDWIHSANVQGNAVRDFTKWDDEPRSLAAVPEVTARAFRVATTEPAGPVYLALDAGLQEDELDEATEPPDFARLQAPSRIGPDPAALRELAQALVEAERPIMVPGYPGRDPQAFYQLVELAELVGIGVVDTQIRPNFPNRHPLNVTGSPALEEADLVFFVDVKDMGKPTQTLDSTSRAIRNRINDEAKVVDLGFNDLGISAWSHDFATLHETDLQVTADTVVALPMLLELCRDLVTGQPERREGRARWKERLRELHELTWATWRKESGTAWDEFPISTARLAAEVWEAVRDHDWVLTGGTAAGWSMRTFEVDAPHRWVGRSVGTATQISVALGVALAHRGTGRLIVDLQPDGDLMYDLGALWVAAHYELPLLVVTFNNRAYYNDWEHQERMARQRGRPLELASIGMELDRPAPDLAAIARALGWFGEGPVTDPAELGKAVNRAVEVVTTTGRPALVDVVCAYR